MKAFLALCALFLSLLSVPAFAVVNLNTATQSQLESVRGIGPTKAKAIIEYRTKHGPFKSVDDLGKVRGFGEATLAKLKGELTVEAPKTAK